MSGEPQAPATLETDPQRLRERLWSIVRKDVGRLTSTGVPHLFLALMLTQGISMLRRILLARILTVDQLGQMTYVMQIVDFLAICADIGICTAVLKYAAEPVSDERRRELYCAGLLWSAVWASVTGLLYFVAAAFMTLHPEAQVRFFLLLVAPYIPLSALVKTPFVFMQARKEIRRSAQYTAITQVLSLVVLVGATYFYGLNGFFFAVTVAPLSNLVLLLYATRRELRWYRSSMALLGKLARFGLFSMLANIAGHTSPVVTVVLLRQLTGTDATVGLFAIALMVMSTMRLLTQALTQTAFPYLSGLLGDPQRLGARVRELSVKQTLVMAAAWVAWWVVGWYAIVLVFGGRFAGAYGCSVLLLASNIPFAVSAATGQALLVLGLVKINFCAGLIMLTLNALICTLLIPRFGMLGAAMSMVASQLTATCFSVIMLRSTLSRLTGATAVPSARPGSSGGDGAWPDGGSLA